MLPSKRVYFLLILGIAIAPTLAFFVSIPASIFLTLLFDVTVLGLMVVDGLHGDRIPYWLCYLWRIFCIF